MFPKIYTMKVYKKNVLLTSSYIFHPLSIQLLLFLSLLISNSKLTFATLRPGPHTPFLSLSLFSAHNLQSIHTSLRSLRSPFFSMQIRLKKGFLTLKARLAPFSRLVRVSDIWLSAEETTASLSELHMR